MVAIVLVALGLRLYHLDAQSLWNDEGTSVALAQRDLTTIARHASYDIHPPLYYYLLHGWIALAGTNEIAVRSLSVVAGVALVVGVWALARRLVGAAAAALAALLATVAPFQVYYSQEARMYIWVALFGLLATIAFERLLSNVATRVSHDTPPSSRASARDLDTLGGLPHDSAPPHPHPLPGAPGRGSRWPVAYGLAAIATVYSHYLGATVLLAHNLAFVAWWAWQWRRSPYPGTGAPWRSLGAWVLLQGLIILAYVPWLAVSWRSLGRWPVVSADFAVAAMLGDALRAMVWGPDANARWEVTAVAGGVALLALLGLLATWRGVGDQQDRVPSFTRNDDASLPSPRWFGGLVLALYLAAPIVVMALASLERPMYKTKFVLLATPPLYVLVGVGVAAIGRWVARLLGRRGVGVIAGALVMLGVLAPSASGLGRLYWDRATYRDDYRGIAAYIAEAAGPDDAILINAPSQIETFGYYYQGTLPIYPLPRQRPIDVHGTVAELEALAERHDRIYAVLWATNESDPERVIEGWLDIHAFKAMDRWFGDVRLAMWALPRSTEGAIVAPAGHLLGGQVRLSGYSILTPEPVAGDVLQVALHWEALAPIAERYKVFVHLVDAGGTIVAQRDSEPGGGARLTSDWAPGEGVTDLYGLLILPDVPPGDHLLRVGMYALDGGERLPVSLDGRPIGDAIDLARVHVGGAE